MQKTRQINHEPGSAIPSGNHPASTETFSYVGNDRYSGRIFSDSLESCRVVLRPVCCKLCSFLKPYTVTVTLPQFGHVRCTYRLVNHNDI